MIEGIEYRLRHIDSSESVPFMRAPEAHKDGIISRIKSGGGVYCEATHQMELYFASQYVLGPDSGYIEIIVGADGDDS